MRLLLRRGQRAAALKQYQPVRRLVERELGVEPEKRRDRFYRDILRSTGSSPDRAGRVLSSRQQAKCRLDEARWSAANWNSVA